MRLFFSILAGGNSCVACGSYTALIPVCRECDRKYFSTKECLENRCTLCGKELVSLEGRCMKCRSEPLLVNLDRLYPLFSYRLWNKSLLFEWKIEGKRALSEFFAGKITSILKKLSMGVVIPVPPRKGKIRQKGWDQINELAEFLKRRYGFRVLNLLVRLSEQEQKKLSREERLEKIKTAYVLVKPSRLKRILKPFSGKIPEEVCLVDDVSTTGSTLECCAAVLKKAGVKKVFAVTLFTVD